MQRIRERDLQAQCDRINDLKGTELSAYTKLEDGTYRANIGNFHLSFAYGGVALHRMCGERGGVEDVFRCGHMPKRELYGKMCAFLVGIAEWRDREVRDAR